MNLNPSTTPLLFSLFKECWGCKKYKIDIMIIIKRTIGSCFFTYEETFNSENEAVNGKDGKFIAVTLGKLRIERANITKENDEQGHQNFDKAKTDGREKI